MEYKNLTLEDCIESYKMGVLRICNGDTKDVTNGLTCFCCGKYFESHHFPLYCPKCVVNGLNRKGVKNV